MFCTHPGEGYGREWGGEKEGLWGRDEPPPKFQNMAKPSLVILEYRNTHVTRCVSRVDVIAVHVSRSLVVDAFAVTVLSMPAYHVYACPERFKGRPLDVTVDSTDDVVATAQSPSVPTSCCPRSADDRTPPTTALPVLTYSRHADDTVSMDCEGARHWRTQDFTAEGASRGAVPRGLGTSGVQGQSHPEAEAKFDISVQFFNALLYKM